MSIPKMWIKFLRTLVIFLVISGWIFSGWPPIWQNPPFPSKVQLAQALNTDIEKVKIKFDASQLAGKYERRGASFRKTVKADNAEKTEVKIGNETGASFEPSFEFKKWDEVRFKLTPKMETVAQEDKDFDVAGDKIKYKTTKEEVHFYELADSPNLLGGGYEIERILNEKPTTNVLSFDIETENLEFFYQPVYTDAEIEAKASEEDFVNKKAMGSYAVYYKNVPLNYVGGKKYGIGKVGHIYRPRIDDAAGNWTYGDLNIDIATKKLTVTIPQDFLDKAVYPIYHASGLVFGYQTIGTAGNITIENSIKGSVFTMGTNAGAVDSITVYSNPSGTARTFGTAIYLSSSNALIANSGSTAQTPAASGAAWRTVNYATRPSLAGGTNYTIAEWGSSGTGTHVIYYDTGTTNQGQTDANTSPFTWPNPLVPSGTTNKYSIYATYTPVPDAPTGVAATDGTYTNKVTITWTKSTGATDYHVWRDAVDLGAAGDVATFDDTGANAPTITAGSAVAGDGASTAQVDLSLSGASANNGTTHTYKVVASNAAGNSVDSATNTGYMGVGALTYQWQKSAADSDASYSNIGGATASTYADTAAPADGSGRYYKVIENAIGATQQISTANRGYRQVAPNAPTQDSPANSATNVSITPSLSMTATDPNADNISYKVTVYSNSGCTTVVFTNDKAVNGANGWSGMNATCTAAPTGCYSSGTQGTFTTQSPLSYSTQYWWKASAKDPDGSTTFTDSSTCNTFTTLAAPVYSVSVTPAGDITYGFVSLSNSTTTVGSTYTKTATNDGTATEKLNVKSSDATGGTQWTLGTSIGSNIFKHEVSTTTGSTYMTFQATDTYLTASTSVAVSGTVTFDFRLTAPSSSSDYQQKSITITVQAVAP